MKTNLTEISRAYRGYLRDEWAPGEGACPTIERLSHCVLGDVTGEERSEIVGHAANCGACAAALKSLLDLSAETDRVAAEFERSAGPGEAVAPKPARMFWARLAGKPALAVAAGIFFIAVSSLLVFQLLDRSGTRGAGEERLRLVSPVAGSFARDGLEFRWESLAGADHYTVGLFDQSLKPVWRSGPVRGNEVRLSDDVVLGLKAGEAYFWAVTAVKGDHAEVKSRLAEFSVKK